MKKSELRPKTPGLNVKDRSVIWRLRRVPSRERRDRLVLKMYRLGYSRYIICQLTGLSRKTVDAIKLKSSEVLPVVSKWGKPRRNGNLPQEVILQRRKEAKLMFEQGQSYEDIAEKFGVSRGTIFRDICIETNRLPGTNGRLK